MVKCVNFLAVLALYSFVTVSCEPVKFKDCGKLTKVLLYSMTEPFKKCKFLSIHDVLGCNPSRPRELQIRFLSYPLSLSIVSNTKRNNNKLRTRHRKERGVGSLACTTVVRLKSINETFQGFSFHCNGGGGGGWVYIWLLDPSKGLTSHQRTNQTCIL